MERLKSMKDTLVGIVQTQLANAQNVDTKELGEAVDMIKDLEEAMYYCSIVKAMEKQEKEEEMYKKMPKESYHYYTEYKPYPYPYMMGGRDIDRDFGRMYYPEMMYYGERGPQPRDSEGRFTERYYNGGGNGSSYGGGSSSGGNGGGSSRGGSSSGSRNFYERELPFDLRDYREGRSPMSRKMYMESKEMHKGKDEQIKELEKYMQELSQDVTEMIEDASPEEKKVLENKMAQLTSKISQLNK